MMMISLVREVHVLSRRSMLIRFIIKTMSSTEALAKRLEREVVMIDLKNQAPHQEIQVQALRIKTRMLMQKRKFSLCVHILLNPSNLK
jgi:hypothetical protein